MRKLGNEAAGLVETLGMLPAIEAADKMLKAADVDLVSYENVGSTLVTVMVKGDIAAVESAVEAGAESAKHIGKVTAKNVMKRPVKAVADVLEVHGIEEVDDSVQLSAIGGIETFGLVFVLEAADAMIKAADVEFIGYENVASGYISMLVKGDVAAVQSAVEAGERAVKNMGAEIYAKLVIPSPHRDLFSITERYSVDNLLP